MQGLILLNKPKGITSYGVVSAIKRLTGEKRVGHTGTLDPMATGVLPVLIGRATALSSYMLDADKRYIASVKLGITTDTEDITGTVIEEKTVDITSEQLYEVLNEFKGIQMQRPPMYSALKKDGIPMYKLARNGEIIDIPEREIEVYSLDLVKPLDSEGKCVRQSTVFAHLVVDTFSHLFGLLQYCRFTTIVIPQLCDSITIHLMLVICLSEHVTDVAQLNCVFVCIDFSSPVTQ